MKIALINGSPKMKNSASGYILKELKNFLEKDDNKISEYHFGKPKVNEKEIELITKSDVLVFLFPLYVDEIPSHLLSCLIQLQEIFLSIGRNYIKVYTLVNCGFYEGHQNKIAIEMMENWCFKAGLKWGQGIGIGAGAMLPEIKNVPIEHGPKKNLGKALKQLASNILNVHSEENIFITANFPRFLYKFSAQIGWQKDIKKNGLKRKDLFLKK